MPTVIVMDVSLSMSRTVTLPDSTETMTRQQLGVRGLNILLNHIQSHCRLEFVSLIAFSSLYQVLCPFTRDFDQVRSKLRNLEDYDKTCIEAALHGVNSLVQDEWGNNTPCQVLIITDGSVGMGPSSLAACLANSGEDDCPLPFTFPGSLSIICLAHADEPGVAETLPMYQKLIELAGGQGTLFTPEGPLNTKTVDAMFKSLVEMHFSSFQGILQCGHLSSNVVLSPAPQPYFSSSDPDSGKRSISTVLDVCGFIDVADIGSPMVVSRHLVLPGYTGRDASVISVKVEADSEEEGPNQDEGRIPSFCVLLHGALRVENMVALCIVGDAWYGIIYSWADTKKKSNIMLSILPPGINVIPWLGPLDCLGLGTGKDPNETLPVKPSEKRSYAQNYVVWIRQAGLQSDVQKILRHARKLPDKTQQFYKELNRVRRAALVYGFVDLLQGLAEILERECTMLPGASHPDCALQMTHAASILRNPICRDVQYNIMPLRTRFAATD